MIRAETSIDIPEIYKLNCEAFNREAEAKLVNDLRNQASPIISLVYLIDHHVVGHIMLSPVCIDGIDNKLVFGLAPLAVAENFRKRGIASELIYSAISAAKKLNSIAIVVLGDPKFYQRFGFSTSSKYNFKSEYAIAEQYFMALELVSGSLNSAYGIAKYHLAFSKLD